MGEYASLVALFNSFEGCELDCRAPGREYFLTSVKPFEDLCEARASDGDPLLVSYLEERADIARTCALAQTGKCALREKGMLESRLDDLDE